MRKKIQGLNIKIENLQILYNNRPALKVAALSIPEASVFAIMGDNGSGKTMLGQIISGKLPNPSILSETDISFKTLEIPQTQNIGYVSFEEAERILETERLKDDSDYTDGPVYEGVIVKDFIHSAHSSNFADDVEFAQEIITILRLDHILNRGIRFLSNGEMRKILIARVLIGNYPILVLDEPFDGMDFESTNGLKKILAQECQKKKTLILILNNLSDIIPTVTAGIYLNKNHTDFTGDRTDLINYMQSQEQNNWDFFSGDEKGEISPAPQILIKMKNVEIKYDNRKIFELPHWEVKKREHWVIYGPNGAGKSSLLGMISGDNVKAYGQDIELFGRKKGTGEDIWEVKQKIGWVSRELQNQYRVNIPLLQVILSGCYDSIGLYERPTLAQQEEAARLAACIGWDKLKFSESFKDVSYGEQRLALLLRAIIKQPELILLDEPCQGLDESHRHAFLTGLDALVTEIDTTLLFVTHRQKEIPEWINKRLVFELSNKNDSQFYIVRTI